MKWIWDGNNECYKSYNESSKWWIYFFIKTNKQKRHWWSHLIARRWFKKYWPYCINKWLIAQRICWIIFHQLAGHWTDYSLYHYLNEHHAFWDLSQTEQEKKAQGGFRLETYSYHLQHSVLFMSEESKFKLKLLEFGRLHCFTHAKTQRAGGFYNKEGVCALIHKVGLRLFTLAFHTQISLLSCCQVDSLMRGWSARDLGVSQMLAALLFKCPQRLAGRVLGASTDKYATSSSK